MTRYNGCMKFPDPLGLKYEQPRDVVLFAASQLQGNRKQQEDYFVNFNDECFVVADGVGSMPHAAEAAQLAGETSIWAYKHVRQRHTYWGSKRLFLKRIVRTTNMTIWQKQRETGFTDGMATTLLVLIVGDKNIWMGNVGDASAFFLHEGAMKRLTKEDVDSQGKLTKVLGKQRLGIVPQVAIERFYPNDTVLLATDGVTRYVSEPAMQEILLQSGTTAESLTDTVVALLRKAEANGSRDNMTAVIVKRIYNIGDI
ncbi:MAG: Protein serine/threonine phosphatase [Candidatus Gottesmanbacteria bacterium GW2011_GWA2_47_9]|uniref:Protein serine/threonine phosphatase n=3 Tax=Candidatus Gottesmaniibacteriota TaxID=1752720 RepID=A0A0G1UNF5_9BACT|nr:MAG: Protein serine/threonine phosphatase [Candidatus Gottesmanbacteria bacterium GW2011_GWA2_47_9]KKU95616.1 MAG: Protein serine/threonine phosphatase [Candidatus Gottesmanbacteria bacterium GW2011_GWA1_48_13]